MEFEVKKLRKVQKIGMGKKNGRERCLKEEERGGGFIWRDMHACMTTEEDTWALDCRIFDT